jgi:hypothetical protein
VRCPLHDCRAEVTALSDPAARPGRRHVEIVGCSLLSSAAVALPERRAYLADTPPCEVVLEPGTTHAVYAPEAACRQPCLFVLNAAASGTVAPLTCASGVSDGIDLMRQADGEAAGRQSLWFGSSS